MTKGKVLLVTGFLVAIGALYWASHVFREAHPAAVVGQAEDSSTEILAAANTEETPIPTVPPRNDMNPKSFSSPPVDMSAEPNAYPLPRGEDWPRRVAEVQASALSTQKSEQQESPEVKPALLTNLFEAPVGYSSTNPPLQIFVLGRTNLDGLSLVIFRVLNTSSVDYFFHIQNWIWNGGSWVSGPARMEPPTGGIRRANAGMEDVFEVSSPPTAARWKLCVRYVSVATRQEEGAFWTVDVQER